MALCFERCEEPSQNLRLGSPHLSKQSGILTEIPKYRDTEIPGYRDTALVVAVAVVVAQGTSPPTS